jgi:hypothetical protein
MEWREFGQTIDCGYHIVVDHDRLSKLFASMHEAVSNRVNAEIPPFKPARLLQQLPHVLDRLRMGRDSACRLDYHFPSETEHQLGGTPNLFD